MRAQLAHVAERHRRGGRVLRFYHRPPLPPVATARLVGMHGSMKPGGRRAGEVECLEGNGLG